MLQTTTTTLGAQLETKPTQKVQSSTVKTALATLASQLTIHPDMTISIKHPRIASFKKKSLCQMLLRDATQLINEN